MALRKISQPKITVYQLPRSYSSLTLAAQEYAINARFSVPRNDNACSTQRKGVRG